ncbi:MAG: hypothetical protein ACK4FL_00100 [Microgenomates group bacterium]
MENQNKSNPSNFWFGFISGAFIGLSIAFLLGTKKGRKFLKNIIELSENFEENLSAILKEIEEKTLKKEVGNINENNKQTTTVNQLLNKIKNRLTF